MRKNSIFGKILKETLLFVFVLAVALHLPVFTVSAASFFPGVEKFCGLFPCPEGTTGIEMTKNLVGKIIDNVRVIIGVVAVIVIVVSGIKLIAAGGNEEVLTKQTSALMFAIIGLFFVGIAGELAQIFDVDRGGFLRDPNTMIQRTRLFNRSVEILITFIKYTIGSVAVLFIVRSSIRLVLMGDEEEQVTKDKKSLFYGLIGLVVIMMANPIINKIFFKIDLDKYPGMGTPVQPAVDRLQLVKEIAGATNIVAAIAGPLALVSLVASGLMYIVAGSDEEKLGKAKKMIMWSLISIIIIYGAFAIVSTFIARQFAF